MTKAGQNWKHAVADELERLYLPGEEFTLTDFYEGAESRLQTLYPHNNTVRASVRQGLQQLRDTGTVRFDGNGRYTYVGTDSAQPSNNAAVWGIHNDTVPADILLAEGYVSIGWDEIGDLRDTGENREALKNLVASTYPDAKPGAIRAWAGTLHRFAFVLDIDDLVVAPSKQQPVYNIGRVTGPYDFNYKADEHRHRRQVEWLATGVPRVEVSQAARHSLGSATTLFSLNEHANEIRQLIDPEFRPSKRAWLIRGSSINGTDLVPIWRKEGWVSLAAANLRPVTAEADRNELRPIIEEDYAHASYAVQREKLDEFHAFLSRMREGDIVVTVDREQLFFGTLRGEPRHQPSANGDANLVRDVEWVASKGVDIQTLPGELGARLKVQRDVLDLTQLFSALADLMKRAKEDRPSPPVEAVVLPAATNHLAESLNVPKTWLQECVDLLNDRPQLIFYGPPGTGKTYIAQALAKHVAGDHVRLVQFHPSYAYEDFFEGYRPTSGGGFELKPGPMRKIVDQAVENPRDAFVLIIDEINRGNLAKVFGELYFLLEYRDQNVELLYADEDFTLPKNVYIIGTMNTADRSIALVDAAMRRRFAFLPLHPTELPTRDVLQLWLKQRGHSSRTADLLEELNRRIEDPDFKIGPSYFMREAVHAAGGVERTWRTSILPLLEEHHFGELDTKQVSARYGLKAVAAVVDKKEEVSGAPTDSD